MTDARVTVLGCGNSTGVPAVGNYWGACDPANSKNRRLRSSIAVQKDQTSIVIDTGPDFREQMNRANIATLDAVLYTHSHGDHVNGIDDLRAISFRRQKNTPVYGNKETLDDLKSRFFYLFEGGKSELYPPIVEPHLIEEGAYGQPLRLGQLEFVPFIQDHGTCESVGYRFGNFAYSVDMVNLDDKALDTLSGIDIWLVDAAGYKSETPRVHASIERILKLNEKIGARQIFLSSLSLAMDYDALTQELPEYIQPAYDGLQLDINLFDGFR